MNWYHGFTKIAQRKFLEDLGVSEAVIQYVEEQPNEVKQYLVNALRQNAQLTVEELQSITIPQREVQLDPQEEQLIQRFEPSEFREWLQVQLIKLRAGRQPNPILHQRLMNTGLIDEIADWREFTNPDLSAYSMEQAVEASEEWHRQMAAEGAGKIYQEKNVVHTFDDGWTIQEVKTRNDLAVEGNKMGHCVGRYCPRVEAEELRIFSLRDPRNEPHVTIESDMVGEKIEQIQGKENARPLPKYMQYLFEWKGEEVEPLEDISRYSLGGQFYFADGSTFKEYKNKQGELHREDGPAVIYANGNKEWWLNRKLHRENGPAIEWANGNKDWYFNGKRHRENGPAIEYANGRKDWYLNGELHRKNGPAIERANGDKDWFINGKLHREDGPAVERADGSKAWYLNGKLHREGGPAIEHADGTKLWYLNGKRHREDGPAGEYADGTKYWYLNGKLHREDGPAVEWANGDKAWYLNGVQISEREYWEKVKRLKSERESLKKANNWYHGFTKIAQRKFLEDLGVAEAVIQYVESQPNEVKQYLVNALRQNAQLTVEELQSITIPQREVQLDPQEEQLIQRFEPSDFAKWLQVQLIRLRAGRQPNPTLHQRLMDTGLIDEIADWREFTNPDLSTYNMEQAVEASEEWHRQMAAEGAGKTYQEKNIIHTFDDGWTIQEVKTRNDLQVEGNKMGHCVGRYCPRVEAEELRIFSLRDPRNEPHVTIESDMAGEEFEQIQGKENETPLPKYMQYVLKWKGEEVEPLEDIARYSLGGQFYFADGSTFKEYRNKQGKLHRENGPAVIDANGRKDWYFNGKLHRENGPAVERADGAKFWYIHDKRHRENGPAIELANGDKLWYINGKLHREDGPAVEYANGNKHWYLHDKLHREDGPAVEYANGDKEWYLNGKLHREDGPAIEYTDGRKEWWLNGKLHIKYANGNKYWYLQGKLHRENGPAVIYANGIKEWYLNGELHRENGPAIEYADGSKYWYLNGERHRKNGPAIERADGTKKWYLNGKLHREDGPALEYADGRKDWYRNGKLHREDGPAIEYADGDKLWYLNGELHREDEPAVEYANGAKYWYLNGGRHREDGPAVIYADGTKAWYLNGVQISEREYWEKVKRLKSERESLKKANNWYNKFTKIAQRKFLEDLGVAEAVIQYVESQPNEVKQYLVNALRQNSQMTVEELQQITIPQREAVSPTADEQNILNRIPAEQNEFRDWLSSQLIKARAGRIPNLELHDRLSSDYGQLLDWHNFVNPDLDSYSAEQALISSDEWHRQMAAKGAGKAYQEKNVVHSFPDGWTIQEVKTRNDLQVEGNKMGHCVGRYCPGVEAEELRIFSLRDPRNEPHVTIESDMAGENFEQIQGKENETPLPKYMQYIFEWKGEEVEPLEGMARYDLGGQTYFADGSQLKEYRNKQGELHREDGPAVIYANGDKRWYLNGKRHRENEPAIEYSDGDKEWWLNGKRHRENGPAIELANGHKEWYLNGELHRENGPAIEYADGTKYWYLDGRLHREDGPATILANGTKKWFINGELHREDGPAVEWAGGSKLWYLNGNLHRENEPAIEDANGNKEWYLNGERHREDGPAIIFANGDKLWYLNGRRYYSEKEYYDALKQTTKQSSNWYHGFTKIAQYQYTIFCDMDGVLTDFEGHYPEHLDMNDPKNLNQLDKNWWATIPMLDAGAALWRYIQKYNPIILSSPAQTQASVEGKKEWLKKNLKLFDESRIILRYDKEAEVRDENSILIDDRPSKIAAWEAAGGIGILHDSGNLEATLQRLKELKL